MRMSPKMTLQTNKREVLFFICDMIKVLCIKGYNVENKIRKYFLHFQKMSIFYLFIFNDGNTFSKRSLFLYVHVFATYRMLEL